MPPRSHSATALPLRRAVPMSALVTTLVMAGALVAGCGAATGTASLAGSTVVAPGTADTSVAPVTAAATPSPTTAHPAPRPAPTHRPAAASGLPWPAATGAGAADLQKSVDGGSQPWLLDPTEVAESYAAFRGWKDVQAGGGGDATPTRVTVRSSAGTHTLTLAQPGRKGQGGIWLVTADSAG